MFHPSNPLMVTEFHLCSHNPWWHRRHAVALPITQKSGIISEDPRQGLSPQTLEQCLTSHRENACDLVINHCGHPHPTQIANSYLPAFLTNPMSASTSWQRSQRKHSGCQLLFMALITRPMMNSPEGSNTHKGYPVWHPIC
jgi:hypothetical protein